MRKLHISKNALLATRRLGKVCLACGLLLALAACSSSDPADSLPDTTDTTDGDADTSEQEKADGETLVGTFVVSLTAPLAASGTQSASEGKASFSGVVNDGPTPVGTLFEAFQTVGACTLYKPRVPFCESACLNGAVCVEDGHLPGLSQRPGSRHAVRFGADSGHGRDELHPSARQQSLPSGGKQQASLSALCRRRRGHAQPAR